MITTDQLKDIKERTEALYRYLDIENKTVQVEEDGASGRRTTPYAGSGILG